jgi:hypothetical protein
LKLSLHLSRTTIKNLAGSRSAGKNKNFFRKEQLGRSALIYAKNYKDGAMPRLLRAEPQSKSMGRAWCGHARPTKKPRKFCFKEQRLERYQGAEFSLKN